MVRKTNVERTGVDTIMTIECGDGDTAIRGTNLAQAFPPGTSLKEIAKGLLQGLISDGVSVSNAERQIQELINAKIQRAGKSKTGKGQSYTGSAAQNFTKFLNQYNIKSVSYTHLTLPTNREV